MNPIRVALTLLLCSGLIGCHRSAEELSARKQEERIQKEAARDDWPSRPELEEPAEARQTRGAAALNLQHGIHGMFFDSAGRLVMAGTSSASRRLPTSFQYDTSFGGGSPTGTQLLPGTSRFARSIAVAPSGAYWVTGRVLDGPLWRLALWRLRSNGQVDTSFGVQGLRGFTFGSGSAFGRDVYVDSQGRVVVAGYSYQGQTTDALVVRFLSDGSPDPSFGTDGSRHFALGANDDEIFYSLLPRDAGYYLAGSVHVLGDRGKALLARIQSNGDLDTAWGTAGMFTQQFGSVGDTWTKDLYRTPSDQLAFYSVARIGARAEMVMARLNSSGTFDTSFNTNGYLEITAGTGQLTAIPTFDVKTDGSFVAAVPSRYLVRIYTNGTLDTGFGENADGTMEIGLASSVVLVSPADAVNLGGTSSSILYYNSPSTLSIMSTTEGNAASPTRFGYVARTTGTRTATLQLRGYGRDTVTGLAGGTLSPPYRYVGGSYPGTGGTCTDTLGINSTCNVMIEIGTASVGTLDSFVTFDYVDGGVTKTMRHYVMARGSALTADTVSHAFGTAGACTGDSLVTREVVVTNSTGSNITDLTGEFTGDGFWEGGGSFPGTGGTCASTLNNGESCTLKLGQPDPSVVGDKMGMLAVYSPTLDQGLEAPVTASWISVDLDQDGVNRCTDCDDNNADAFPGNTELSAEVCDNGIDEDCSGGDLACADLDLDGDGYSVNQGDCDDNDPTLSPADLDFDSYSTCSGDCNDFDGGLFPGNGC